MRLVEQVRQLRLELDSKLQTSSEEGAKKACSDEVTGEG